jgi:hypothetical protein
LKVPAADGVPLIVIVFAAHAAVTPAGKLVGVPMPVAPEVVWMIGVSAVFIHNVGVEEGAPTVLVGFTAIVPEALTVPQPPVRGMV